MLVKVKKAIRRWNRWERYTLVCERNGGTATLRHGYGRAQEILLTRLIRRDKLVHGGDWWK